MASPKTRENPSPWRKSGKKVVNTGDRFATCWHHWLVSDGRTLTTIGHDERIVYVHNVLA
jgi:hypothetical protein